MTKNPRRVAALIGAAVLLAPAVAGAKPGAKPEKPVKLATYVFKGVWNGDGTVTVTGGNAKVRKGGLVGDTLAFDVTTAKLRVADTDGDGPTAADLLADDKVVVQAKLPRTGPVEGEAIVARKVVDQTHPAVEEAEVVPPVEPAPVP